MSFKDRLESKALLCGSYNMREDMVSVTVGKMQQELWWEVSL